MPARSGFTDDSVLLRWMRLELDRINAGIVIATKNLAQLLKEDSPSAKTKGGNEYIFDREVVRSLGEKLPVEMHGKLRLPILFHADMEVSGSLALYDETAVRALKALGEISELRTFERGKLWIARPIVYALMGKYPTIIQMMMG